MTDYICVNHTSIDDTLSRLTENDGCGNCVLYDVCEFTSGEVSPAERIPQLYLEPTEISLRLYCTIFFIITNSTSAIVSEKSVSTCYSNV